MKTSRKYLKIAANIFTMLAGAIFCIWLLPLLIRFFMPFIIAGIIALIANPIVRFLEKHIKIKRKAGSAFVIISVIALVSIGVYAAISWLIEQFIGFVKLAPSIWLNVSDSLLRWQTDIMHSIRLPFDHVNPGDYNAFVSSLSEKASVGVSMWFENMISRISDSSALTISASSIPTAVISVIMSIIASYMFVAESEYLGMIYKKIIPKRASYKIAIVTGSIKNALEGYILAQLKIMAVVYVILFIGLWILGVDFFGLVALLIAILDFLPIFGTGTVMVPWAVIALIQSNYKLAIGLLAVWGISQLVRKAIEPRILSKQMGLDPIPTLFLLYIGFKVGGALGLILAAPIGLIIRNLYKAGFFDDFILSIKILIHDFSNFRRFTKEEKKELQD